MFRLSLAALAMKMRRVQVPTQTHNKLPRLMPVTSQLPWLVTTPQLLSLHHQRCLPQQQCLWRILSLPLLQSISQRSLDLVKKGCCKA